VDKIEKQYNQRAYINRAILDATQINPHDFGGDRANGLIKPALGRKFQKLKPWLSNVRDNRT